MKKYIKSVCVILSALIVMVLTSCDLGNPLYGEWKDLSNPNLYIILNKDKSFEIKTYSDDYNNGETPKIYRGDYVVYYNTIHFYYEDTESRDEIYTMCEWDYRSEILYLEWYDFDIDGTLENPDIKRSHFFKL